jgi:DNA-binding HxlR family transcriptional regulator
VSNPAIMSAMDYLATDTSNCSLGRTVDLVGQPWVVLILREVVWGVRRFSDMQAHMGVSKSVLSDRLDHLVEHGVLERREYRQPGQRKRSEYHLTEKGKDLYPVLSALRQWGDKYLAGPEGPSMVVTHMDCGARVHVKLMCEEGHEVPVDELERHPGPGMRLRAA